MGEFTSSGFPDALDPVLDDYILEGFNEGGEVVDRLFTRRGDGNRGDLIKVQEIYGMGKTVPERGATLQYFVGGEGYSTTATHKAFAAGTQYERELWDDKRHDDIGDRSFELGLLFGRHVAQDSIQILNQMFSLDTEFMSREEGLAICSNSHTTNDTSVSTANGFDNLSTENFSKAALEAAFSTFRKFKTDDGVFIDEVPDTIASGVELNDQIEETISTPKGFNTGGGLDVNKQSKPRWSAWSSVWFTSSTNWCVYSMKLAKRFNRWVDRVPFETGKMEHFDSFTMRKRAYQRYSYLTRNWRWIYGFNSAG